MAEKKDFTEIKTTTLISVIVHGANQFGLKLAQTIAGQGSKVIVIDKYDKETKDFVKQLKKEKQIDFVAFEGLTELYETLERFDYLFYLQFTTLGEDKKYTSKDFLSESDRVDKTLEAALKHKAKVAIVTSINKNKKLIEITQLEEGKPKPYSNLEIQRYTETLTAEHYDKSNLNVRIIRIGGVLGENFDGYDDTDIQRLFSESVGKDRLTIIGEGLDNHYIIHYEDAVFGILKLTFNHKTNGEVISLCNPNSLTTLSVAYKILELNPEANKIDFVEDQKGPLYKGHYTLAPNATKYSWKPTYTIEDTFVETLTSVYALANKKWTSDKAKPKEEKKGKEDRSVVQTVKTPFGRFVDKLVGPFVSLFAVSNEKKGSFWSVFNLKTIITFFGLLTLFLLLSYFLFTPAANILYGGYRAGEHARLAYQQTQEFQLGEASENFDDANHYLKTVEIGLERVKWIFNITGQEELYSNSYLLLSSADYATRGARDMTNALEPLADYFNDFQPALSFDSESPTNTTEYREYLEELRERRNLLIKAADSLRFASQLITQVDPNVFPKQVQPYVNDLKINNALLADSIKPFQETIYFLPELLGVDERQRYLILLQNPGEIRSTGGWISSYAIVGIEGGQIRQLEVDDVYNLDGALRVQGKNFEAPESMQNALDVEDWNLATSNWNPDFPSASEDAEFFIKEAGKAYKIDGAFAINTDLLSKFLEYWGGIDVPGETEKVTSENLQQKIFEIHNEFEPGSDRKSTFIADLANEILKKFLSEKGNYADFGNILYESFNEKHLLGNLSNPGANVLFATQGWDGALDEKYKSTPIPIEWNWGANKANLFVETNTSTKIKVVDEDNLIYTYSLSVKNNSTTDTYPEGEYKNWHRLYLPEKALITETEGFDSNTQNYFEKGFKVLGAWFITPPQGTNQVVVTYEMSRSEDDPFPIRVVDDSIFMDLNVFKQSGKYPDDYKLEIEYPDQWAIIEDGKLNRSINLLSTQFPQETDYETTLMWNYK